jgi:hypothetical protein
MIPLLIVIFIYFGSFNDKYLASHKEYNVYNVVEGYGSVTLSFFGLNG